MIRYIHAEGLAAFPKLQRTMYRDRALQFHDRLDWAVDVDAQGWERDPYDALNPLYVIWQERDGSHGGSMRFMPTTGPTMLNDHFARVAGRRVEAAGIWETTRFCQSPGAGARVSAALMLAGAQLGLGLGLSHAAAVFDGRMARVYRQLRWTPQVLGTEGNGPTAISVGLWAFEPVVLFRLAHAAGLPLALSRAWLTRSLPGV